jgi:hypothetical protein
MLFGPHTRNTLALPLADARRRHKLGVAYGESRAGGLVWQGDTGILGHIPDDRAPSIHGI